MTMLMRVSVRKVILRKSSRRVNVSSCRSMMSITCRSRCRGILLEVLKNSKEGVDKIFHSSCRWWFWVILVGVVIVMTRCWLCSRQVCWEVIQNVTPNIVAVSCSENDTCIKERVLIDDDDEPLHKVHQNSLRAIRAKLQSWTITRKKLRFCTLRYSVPYGNRYMQIYTERNLFAERFGELAFLSCLKSRLYTVQCKQELMLLALFCRFLNATAALLRMFTPPQAHLQLLTSVYAVRIFFWTCNGKLWMICVGVIIIRSQYLIVP